MKGGREREVPSAQLTVIGSKGGSHKREWARGKREIGRERKIDKGITRLTCPHYVAVPAPHQK